MCLPLTNSVSMEKSPGSSIFTVTNNKCRLQDAFGRRSTSLSRKMFWRKIEEAPAEAEAGPPGEHTALVFVSFTSRENRCIFTYRT